jgi:hypothetical protein
VNTYKQQIRMRDQIFDYEEKAPFAPSGQSVLGGIEIDAVTNTAKCHECGGWFVSVGCHVSYAHGISAKQYRVKHGLCSNSSLNGPFSHELRQALGRDLAKRLGPMNSPINRNRVGQNTKRRNEETHNILGKCPVQIPVNVRALRDELGRLPTHREVKARGISTYLLAKRYGTGDAGILACCEDRRRSPRFRRPYSVANHITEHLNAVVSFTVANGRSPWRVDLQKHIRISEQSVCRNFGGLGHLLRQAAQLAPPGARKILEARAAQLPAGVSRG